MYAYVNIFKFKKIEYTNKGGATYSLKYYKDYQTISLSEKVYLESDENAVFHPITGDIGVALTISKAISKPVSSITCGKTLGSEVFQVDGLKFCGRKLGDSTTSVTGFYGNNNEGYIVQFHVSYDDSRSINDKAYAEKVLSINLLDFQDDFIKIIKSIEKK